MGADDSLSMDEILEHSNLKRVELAAHGGRKRFETSFVLIVLAAAVLLGCIVSTPSLIDEVDAVQAQITRNMLDTGDWTIAHLDGVPHLEKWPLIYWMIGISYRICGVHLLSDGDGVMRLRSPIEPSHLHLVAESGGKSLHRNLP